MSTQVPKEQSSAPSLDISRITDYLYISAYPHGKDVDEIVEFGVCV